MIYLIYAPNTDGFHYWVTTDTVGATKSANTSYGAVEEFLAGTFNLTGQGNNYRIADSQILDDSKPHGRILAKANTVQSLIDNYPEYFI